MGHDSLFDALLMLAGVWLGLLVWRAWRQGQSAPARMTLTPVKPMRRRSQEPTPFAGLIHQPLCDACAHVTDPNPEPPSSPPPALIFTRGRKRRIDTQHHCWP